MTEEQAIAIAKQAIKSAGLKNIGEVCGVVHLRNTSFEGRRNEWSVSFKYDLPKEQELSHPNSLTVLVDEVTSVARFLGHNPWS